MDVQQNWLKFELSWGVSIAGRVTDAVRNVPIAKASVEITRGPPAFEFKRKTLAGDPAWARKAERLDRTYSQSDGIYVFANLPVGLYHLRVAAPPPVSRYGTVDAGPIRVWASRQPDGRIKLDPADVALPPTRIHGQVTRADSGAAVVGARVYLRGDYRSVSTDRGGRYALGDLIVADPALNLPVPKLEVAAAQFLTASQEVRLEIGKNLEIDVALQLA